MSEQDVKLEILVLAWKIQNNTIASADLVSFFEKHRVEYVNEQGEPFSRQPSIYDRPTGSARMSCSCLCGPSDEPCNELGLGSKTDFTFKKELR